MEKHPFVNLVGINTESVHGPPATWRTEDVKLCQADKG